MEQIDWTPLVSQVGNLLVAVVVALLTRVVWPAVKAYVATQEDARRRALLEMLVLAAEKLWAASGTGKTKLSYVLGEAEKRGVLLTQAEIEATVLRLTGGCAK